MKDITIYKNREISWIQFNERVLEEAEEEENPLLERMTFLSIFMNNLDEFYRVRVGTLCDQMLIDEDLIDDKAGKTAEEQLLAIFKATHRLIPRFDSTYTEVLNKLEDYGMHQIKPDENLTDQDKAYLKHLFEHDIAPITSPFIIEKKHPFPFFENGQIIVGITFQSKNGNIRFGLIPITHNLPRVLFLPSSICKFILIEDLIYLFASKVFHKFAIIEKIKFTIIRNTDINEDEGLYDYDIDLRSTMSKLIERRNVLAPVEIKYCGNNCKKILNHLCNTLYLKKKQVLQYNTPLDFHFLSEIENRLVKGKYEELYYHTFTPRKTDQIDENRNIIDQIIAKDKLLTYPFEDISTMITLIEQAAADERVDSIYMTLYRVAQNSKIVNALINASKNGKKVICVIELRARFDEENNIDLASRLKEANCLVMYGMPMHKIHSKLLLMELNTDEKRRVCLVGTGNFNEITARIYTDIILMTAHKGICDDVKLIFDSIKAGEFVSEAKHLLVAPLCLKTQLIELIDEQINNIHSGKPAGIMLKLNSLTEKDLIDKLYEASQAGVKVRMIIRGICCMIPEIPELTDNIEIRSIVGRFLEHARIYVFGAGRTKRYFISSADFMTRNMTQRVEAAVPVYDKDCKAILNRMLRLNFSDNVNTRKLKSDGKYEKVINTGRKKVDSQMELTLNS